MSASPGESFRRYWTADFYNQLQALVKRSQRITGAGPVTASSTNEGAQIVVPRGRKPLSTIQGILTGGAAPAVTDGTIIIDPCAWEAYSIQAAYFVLSSGMTNLTVNVNGHAVSWLNNLPISASVTKIFVANPPPDLSNVLQPGDILSIVLAGSSGAAGLSFSLNCPF